MRIFCKIFPFDLGNKSTDFPPIKLNFFHHIIIIVIIIIIIIIIIVILVWFGSSILFPFLECLELLHLFSVCDIAKLFFTSKF